PPHRYTPPFPTRRSSDLEEWRADRPNRTRSYCTPILIPDPRRKGVTQLVLSGSKSVTGYDADTGKLLWIIDGPTEQYVASLVYQDRKSTRLNSSHLVISY